MDQTEQGQESIELRAWVESRVSATTLDLGPEVLELADAMHRVARRIDERLGPDGARRAVALREQLDTVLPDVQQAVADAATGRAERLLGDGIVPDYRSGLHERL